MHVITSNRDAGNNGLKKDLFLLWLVKLFILFKEHNLENLGLRMFLSIQTRSGGNVMF